MMPLARTAFGAMRRPKSQGRSFVVEGFRPATCSRSTALHANDGSMSIASWALELRKTGKGVGVGRGLRSKRISPLRCSRGARAASVELTSLFCGMGELDERLGRFHGALHDIAGFVDGAFPTGPRVRLIGLIRLLAETLCLLLEIVGCIFEIVACVVDALGAALLLVLPPATTHGEVDCVTATVPVIVVEVSVTATVLVTKAFTPNTFPVGAVPYAVTVPVNCVPAYACKSWFSAPCKSVTGRT